MSIWSPHLYRAEGAAKGVPNDVVAAALEQTSLLSARRIPPLLTLRHLAAYCGVDYIGLRKVIQRTSDDSYRTFQVRKRLGGHRQISVPCESLMRTQRWIHCYVLRHQSVHSIAYAFLPERGILECASQHCGAKWLVKIDVRQFFESISEKQVYRVFVELGFSRLLAFELARICTRLSDSPGRRMALARWQGRDGYNFYNHGPWIGHLPQGAPTSPMLSNLAMRRLDQRLESLAASKELVVTRYADDVVLSSHDRNYGRSRAQQLIKVVSSILRESGLMVNSLKTHLVPPGARKIVLGLLVDRDRPALTARTRKHIEGHIFGIARFGPAAHAESRGFDSVYGLRRYLEGLLAYASYVDSDLARQYQLQLASVVWY
jgi:RNA-directed DNA polymerase